ncbi:MAG TPA: AI-2E family transporter [Oceanipulchritudo sp.]|nr:AI-2E family transporter [Oceanipulchritudo sp.]
MADDSELSLNLKSRKLSDLLIRLGLIAFLVIMCVRVTAPFVALMLWSLILAVSLYPLHQKVVHRLGGRQGWGAVLLVIAGLALIGLPTLLLGSSFAGHAEGITSAIHGDKFTISQPAPSVADWPVIGDSAYNAWSVAATNLPLFVQEHKVQLQAFLRWILGAAMSTIGSLFLFLGALIVAGIMMAYGESGTQAIGNILKRLAGREKGPKLQKLCTGTIRSVATGVIGVAFIQALLFGIGFLLAAVPAAGILALLTMLIGIMQLPALIVAIPVIGLLWWSGDHSATLNIIFTIYFIVAGLSDNVLKPMLLGRGVDAPMPIILIGALGGMVSGGIVGLFIGAVFLAVGYQIFMDWVEDTEVE